jgi:hypothetical protein
MEAHSIRDKCNAARVMQIMFHGLSTTVEIFHSAGLPANGRVPRLPLFQTTCPLT